MGGEEMARNLNKTTARRQKIRTPKWMDDNQKRMFKSVCRQIIDRQRYVTKSDIELATDYVEARSRVAKLRTLLATESAETPEGSIRIVSLCSQINATTKLAQKIARSLLL